MPLLMKILSALFLCIIPFCMAYSIPIHTSQQRELDQLLKKISDEELFNNLTWLRLLHFRVTPRIAKHSDISSPEFFNAYKKSVHGKLNPKVATQGITAKQELIATLKAFYMPVQENHNVHAQCRFPARFFWLNKKLNFSKKQLPKVQCERLKKWAKFKTLDSVSLIMVSGYFGNPASTFGHLLVKLNNSEYKSSSGNLLDQSINYGAQVPRNESMPMYIAKGILGGYVSSFSDKKFYTQDLVYSKHEFRDMWEYELNLDKNQNRLLVYHIWEMVGMQSTYYFLKENCGYRIAELLELVTGQPLTPDMQPWYLPISVFQELNEVENSRYIKKITFIPSSQRRLYHDFNQLSNKETFTVNKILANPKLLNTHILDNFTVTRKSRMIEVMLSYYQYKLADKNKNKKNRFNQYKNALILERLKLPTLRREKQDKVPLMVSPAEGSKPRLFHFGIVQNESHHKMFEVGLTAIHYDLLSNSKGSLENSELKVLELVLDYNHMQSISVKKLTLISIQKMGLNSTKLLGESNLSWRVSTGFDRNNLACTSCTNFFIQGGMGRSYKPSDNLIIYGMLDSRYSAEKNRFSLSPNLGLITTHNNHIKSVVEAGIDIDIKTGERIKRLKLEARYSLNKNNTLRLSLEQNNGGEFKVSFYHNW